MSAKRFGAIFFDTAKINVWQLLFEAVPLHDTSAVVVFCNQSDEPATVSLAYTKTPYVTPFGPEDIMYSEKILVPKETFVCPVIAVESGANIQVISDIEGVSVIAHGYQDPT